MCPHVNYNEKRKIYEMWYSGGGQHEPDAIGYASSPDGVHWEKFSDQPVFICDPANRWEQHKAAACQVIQTEDYYYMLYIGYHHEAVSYTHLPKAGTLKKQENITASQNGTHVL